MQAEHRGFVVLSVLALVPGIAWAQASFAYFPDIKFVAISADGNTACGYQLNGLESVRWTRFGGVEILPRLPGAEDTMNSIATGMSWDGRVIVGATNANGPRVAWRWEEGVGITALGDLDGSHDNGYPECVSGNGRVAGGHSVGTDGLACVVWDDGGMRVVVDSDNPLVSEIMAMTYSGELMLVVGTNGLAAAVTLRDRSFNRVSTVSTNLTTFSPTGLSETGQTVLGQSGARAAVWMSGSGVELVPNGINGYVTNSTRGMSVDDRVLVGNGALSSGPGVPQNRQRAWIWERNVGMRLLDEVAQEQIGETPPFFMCDVAAISPSGRAIVGSAGTGTRTIGSYVLTLNPPCAADVDDGTGSGARDEDVTTADLFAFIEWMSAGDLRADLDNGTGSGLPDFAISIEDLLYFLTGYEEGC